VSQQINHSSLMRLDLEDGSSGLVWFGRLKLELVEARFIIGS
jgi:hypothetical protein